MKLVICGGSGFVGNPLSRHWAHSGHEVTIVSRKPPEARTDGTGAIAYAAWDDFEREPHRFEGIDAIVNLAGESINQRWTNAAKERILQSRLQAAGRVAALVSKLERKPHTVVNASAISVYGASESDIYDETSPMRVEDFLSSVIERWEKAADEITDVRLVKLRVGVVLGNDGGAYPLIRLPYLFGAGGRIGSGRQWLSWIHIEDIVRLIDFCVSNPGMEGIVNATAPHPVTNDEFGRTVGKVYSRPHWFPVPSFFFKCLFGEMSMLLLEGQRVMPRVALSNGFSFRYPTAEEALRQLKS